MTPTPEQVAQWAREAGIPEIIQTTNPPAFHRLVTRAMAEQAEADAVLAEDEATGERGDEYYDKATRMCAAIIRANAPKVTT